MYNSQYYTCEQIDERLLQGYLDDYNTQTGQSLTKAQFLTKLGSIFSKEGVIDNTATQIGYYECDTAAGTAAKAITVANYALFAGGSMKVKFANKNTANNATLNINSQGAKALYYQGERASATNSWDAEEVVEIYYDGTSYYANNVKGGSGSGVYDVSKEHPTSGPNSDGKFTLEYILNPSNVNELIPVNKRYPGMTIQFVSTSDNKYVQYRLMADEWSTTVADWQGVDDEPTAGSDNLVKSGGVKQAIDASVGKYILTNNSQYAYYGADGTKYNNTGRIKTYPINVVQGDVLVYKNFINPTLSASNICLIAALDENGDFISESSVSYNQGVATIEGQYVVPAGVKQIVFCAKSDASDAVVYRNGSVAENIDILDNRTSEIDGINDRLYSEQENNGSLSLTTNDLKDSHILRNISGDTIQITGTRKVSDLIPVGAGDVFLYKWLYNSLESTPAIVTYSNRETVDTTHCVVITSSSNGTFTVPSEVKYIQLQALGLTSFKYINKSLLTDNLKLNNVLKELYLPIPSADIADFNQVIIFKNYYKSDTGKYITGLQFRKANNTYANYYDQSDAPISDFEGYFANGLKSVIDWSKLETNTRTAFDVQFINYQIVSSLDFNPSVKNHVQDGEINEKIDGRHVNVRLSDLSTGDVTYYRADGTTATNSYRRISPKIPVKSGDIFDYRATNTSSVMTIVAFDKNMALIQDKCVTVNGNVRQTYTVDEGVAYIGLQTQNVNGVYIRLVNDTEGVKDDAKIAKTYPTKIMGFEGFTSNSAWTIAADQKSAVCTKTGVLYRMLHNVISHADKFNLCAKIIPVGETFECLIGKWANTSGTMFCLKFDGTHSYLTTYMIVSQNDIRLSDTINLVNVSLASGKPVFVRIMKRTDDVSYYDVDITDMDGNVDHLTNVGSSDVPDTGSTDDEGHGSTTGYAWGQICMYMLSGTSMTVSDLSYGFPIKDELDLICLGHSYMEGNSIASNKDKRFAAIVCTKISWDNTIILGQGGQSAASLASIIIDYAIWFANAKYALISIGGNDCYDNPTEANINNCIANCTKIRDILVNAGIIPVWVVDSGWVANYQDGVDQISAFSNWLMSQDHYVDARGCFRTGNSNDPAKYLADEKHPSIATHQAIANCIEAQAGYLFD